MVTQGRPLHAVPLGTWSVVLALMLLTALSWWLVVRDATQMTMPTSTLSLADAASFTVQWGVMMAAMMLPSATPMVLMYRTVSTRLRTQGDRAVPVWLFTAVYLVAWLLPGIPLYGAHVAVRWGAERWSWLNAAMPYAVALVIVVAGLYQFSAAKRACLRHCESPLGFVMRRWRSGYAATLRLAAAHAAYCLGCCWGLMVILVVAGAMSLPWVLAITLAVAAEKLLPVRWRAARAIGVVLVMFGVLVAVRPGLAGRLAPPMRMDMDTHMYMPPVEPDTR